MALAHNTGHEAIVADYGGVRNTGVGQRIFGNDWGKLEPKNGVAGRPAQDYERMEYRRHLEPFQAAPYGHTDRNNRVLNGMQRTRMPSASDTTSAAVVGDDDRKWGNHAARSCKRVGFQHAPFGDGGNLRDSRRGGVTTKQLEYRAPPQDALSNPGRRRRHVREGYQPLTGERLPPRAKSEEPPMRFSDAEISDRRSQLEQRQSRMRWRRREQDAAEPFKARPMPDFSGGDELARDVMPGGRRGLTRFNAYLGEAGGEAHRNEIKVKRHRQKIMEEEMERLHDKRTASPGLQANKLEKDMVHKKRHETGERELDEDELTKFISKRGCAIMPARAPHDSQHEENTGDTLANLRKEKGKFEFIGTKEFDALDQDRVFLQQVADQHTYMEEHNSLPPERSFRRGDRASPRDSFGIAGNMASRATKLELTREQRIERQTHSIGKIIRDALAAKRTIGGMVVKDTESLFKAIDKDGSGVLDRLEFYEAMTRLGLGLTPEQISQCIEVLDKDGDNEISLAEFLLLVDDPRNGAKKPADTARRQEKAASPKQEPSWVERMVAPATITPLSPRFDQQFSYVQ